MIRFTLATNLKANEHLHCLLEKLFGDLTLWIRNKCEKNQAQMTRILMYVRLSSMVGSRSIANSWRIGITNHKIYVIFVSSKTMADFYIE